MRGQKEQTVAVKDIHFTIEPGELVAIIGSSGGGKTTLVKALVGVTASAEGVVTLGGEPVSSRLTDVGYVPQGEIVYGKLTVADSFRIGCIGRLYPDDMRGALAAVREVLDEMRVSNGGPALAAE